MDLYNTKKQAIEDISNSTDIKSLQQVEIKYLGRKGIVAGFLIDLKNMSEIEKRQKGKEINKLKREIEIGLEEKRQMLSAKGGSASGGQAKEWFDITVPGIKHPKGHFHPRTLVIREAEGIFQSLGFSVIDGPELETDWYNFEALNIPKDHPARDMQDTFYVANPAGGSDLVMRTHTSPVQVRFMKKNNPPLRIIVPGRVFRREATDASHESQFYQLEGLMVDKHISVANFKAVIGEFFRRFYGRKIAMRLRPSFFPFTEPSFEIDMECIICNRKGCSVCSQSGWIEVIPGGMVNQKVFESAGYVQNEWQGFAFGIGLDRLVMMKYKIDDIRLLNSGDLRFLKQF